MATERECVDCGRPIPYTRGRPPTRCAECKLTRARTAASEWYYSNKERADAQPSRSKEHRRAYQATRPRCAFEECPNPQAYADGLCRSHHSQVVRDGEARPVAHRIKRDNIDAHGYRKIRVGGKAVKEHRVLMERHIGRPLWPFENVHHKNGIKHDNRLANLEIWVTSQPSGQRPEDLAAWVVQFYPEIVRQALTEVTSLKKETA